MNMNQLINMVVRMVMRKMVNHGVNAGINAMSGSNTAGRAKPQDDRQSPDLAANTKQLRQVSRMARRIGRF